jgi:hypothetical protein
MGWLPAAPSLRCPVANSRIKNTGNQVHNSVDGDYQHCRHNDKALDYRQITILNGIKGERADSWPGEYTFDYNGTAYQETQLHSYERNDWSETRPERVRSDNDVLGETFAACRSHEI